MAFCAQTNWRWTVTIKAVQPKTNKKDYTVSMIEITNVISIIRLPFMKQ